MYQHSGFIHSNVSVDNKIDIYPFCPHSNVLEYLNATKSRQMQVKKAKNNTEKITLSAIKKHTIGDCSIFTF